MADIFVRDANLVSLMEKTGYNVTEEYGQRRFGPPDNWTGPPPPKGSEIFIRKLPRDVFEDELVPLCEQFGKIYELRLMMDFNGENRGFSFVTYTNIHDATNAIKYLNCFQIRPGYHIEVYNSIVNCRLFIGGICKDKSKEEILSEISRYTHGVSKVLLCSTIEKRFKNAGFAFLEYDSPKDAAIARRKLLASKITLFGHPIFVDWAQPEAQVEIEKMDGSARGDETRNDHSAIHSPHHHPHSRRGQRRNMFDQSNNYKAAESTFHGAYPVGRYLEMSTDGSARGDETRNDHSAIHSPHHHPHSRRGQRRNMFDQSNNYKAAESTFHGAYPVGRYLEMSTFPVPSGLLGSAIPRSIAGSYKDSDYLASRSGSRAISINEKFPVPCGLLESAIPRSIAGSYKDSDYLASRSGSRAISINEKVPVEKNPTKESEEESFIYSMPIYIDTTGRESRNSGSSSSSSSLLSTTWKYTAYKWVKHEKKFQHQNVNGKSASAGICTSYFDSAECDSGQCCYCKENFAIGSLSSHQRKCMKRPVKCPDCLEFVLLQKWFDEHECQQKKPEGLACVRCEKTMLKNSDLKFTNLECYHNVCNPCCSFLFRKKTSFQVNCPKCNKVIRRRKNREVQF